MNLLVTFLFAIILALAGLAWLGVMVDRLVSPFVSLLFFFPALFLTVWLTWRLSVKLTEPKGEARGETRA